MNEKTIFLYSIIDEASSKFTTDNNREPTEEELIDIKKLGTVVLKKMSFGDQCKLKGKITKISITAQGRENVEVDSEAFFFWQAVLGVKSLPEHPDYDTYPMEKKEKVIGELDPEIGQYIWQEAINFNQIPVTDMAVEKKNPASD